VSELANTTDGVSVPEGMPVRDIGKAVVQLATTWPKAGEWPLDLSTYLEPTSGEEAWGPAMGQAEFRQTFGVLRQPDKKGLASYGIAPDIGRAGIGESLLGRYVRISLSADDGTLTPFWYGTVIEAGRDTDAAEGQETAGGAVWRCAGLGYLLEKTRPITGHEVNPAGGVADPGEVVEFNKVDGGDRSASKHAVGAWGRLAYVHDRRGGNVWRARDVVEYLLYGHADHRRSEMTWDLAGQVEALNFVQHWDLRGLTVYQALVRVINARHGVSFRVEVIAGRPTIYVNSTAPLPFTVNDDTTPANDAASSIVFAGDRWKDNVQLVEKEGLDYDEVVVRGQRPLYTATLMFNPDNTGDLVKGWDTALEASWTPTTKDPKYEHVWRRFVLKPTWNWTPQVGATSVANARRVYPNTEYPSSADNAEIFGDGGFTGGLINQTAPVLPAWPVAALHFERLTGLIEGYDYKAIGAATPGGVMSAGAVDWTVSRLPPLIFQSTDAGSSWSDVSANYTFRCQSDAAAIVLGNEVKEAAKLKALLASSSARLAFTVSFRLPLPALVSWKRKRSDQPRDYPRRVVLPAGHGDTWFIMRDTFVGISGTTPKQMANGLTTMTELNDMVQVLAAMRAWYGQPERELTWTEVGQVDIGATRKPGTMVTLADFGDRVATINGVVTRRAWDFTEAGWGTSYRVDRLKPDLEAVL
jgi:hypothetical protein